MPSTTPPTSTTILMLAGPTGIGKTGLAVEMAQRFGLEIISADSMQVYRGMAVGTAQPNEAERLQARFHVCGMLDPREPFSVQRFLELCDDAHRRIVAAGRLPIYVGGTGLYLRALRWGLFEQAAADPRVRRALEEEVAAAGAPALHQRLAALDPEAAARIAPQDALRIVRALEVHAVTGRRMSELQRQWARPQPRFPHELVVLVAPRDLVRRRIARRARLMLESGWIEETRALLDAGIAPTQHCFKALGYREVIGHIKGRLGYADLVERITTLTWQFARRQMVWLRRERPALWLEAGEGEKTTKVQATIQKLLEKFQTPFV